MWWFIYCVLLFHYGSRLHVGDSYITVGVVLNYSLLLFLFFPPRLPLSISFSFILQGECVSACLFVSVWCLSLFPSLSHFLLFSGSSALTAWCERESNDSGSEKSLEQERAGSNLLFPPCSVLYCLSFAGPLPSPHRPALSSALFVSLSVSLQIPTLWGLTALTMPWSAEWWL